MALDPKTLSRVTVALDNVLQVNYKDFQSGAENWANQFMDSRAVTKQILSALFLKDSGFIRETRIGQPPKYEDMSGFRADYTLRLWESAIRLGIYNASESDIPDLMGQGRQIGQNYAFLNRDITCDKLNTGHTSAVLVYDGLSWFNDAHPKGGVTYDNLLAGTLDATNFQAVRTAMRQFPSDAGTAQPLNIIGTHLVVPNALEYNAGQLMNSSFYPVQNVSGVFGTADNWILKGMATVVTDGRLTDANDWFLLAVTNVARPLVRFYHQDFAPFRIHDETAEDSPAVRDHHEYRWWGRSMEDVFPTHPYLSIKVVN